MESNLQIKKMMTRNCPIDFNVNYFIWIVQFTSRCWISVDSDGINSYILVFNFENTFS